MTYLNFKTSSPETIITVDHMYDNKLYKLYVFETNIGTKRYFRSYSINVETDVLYEVGYYARLLKKNSIEEIRSILMSNETFEIREATPEEQDKCSTEECWN